MVSLKTTDHARTYMRGHKHHVRSRRVCLVRNMCRPLASMASMLRSGVGEADQIWYFDDGAPNRVDYE